MEDLLDKIKKDVKKGIEEGLAVVKQGANVVSRKMTEITEESKRQYKMVDLKFKIEHHMTQLGGKTYDILNKMQNPAEDKKVKALLIAIKKMEYQLYKLEAGKKIRVSASGKTEAKTRTTPKKIVKVSAKKSTKKDTSKSSVKK